LISTLINLPVLSRKVYLFFLFYCYPYAKVLIIEDEASIRAVLKDILKDQKELHLEVDEAKDGRKDCIN